MTEEQKETPFDAACCMAMMEKMMGQGGGCDCGEIMSRMMGQTGSPGVMSQMMATCCGAQSETEETSKATQNAK